MLLDDKRFSALDARAASIQDLDAVVAIHMEAFPGFFLTRLGSKFLKLMYEAFAQDEASVFAIVANDGDVVGFATGAAQQGTQVRRMAGKRAFRLALAIFPALCKSPFEIVKHLFYKLFAMDGHPSVEADSVILRSIAVANKSLGTGAAVELLRFFESKVKEGGFSSVTLTTDATANERVNNFYHKAGYLVKCQFTQKPDRLMNLYQKKFD
jgi:ribosomal protein S18 acetylase RimI-like enzyme